MKRSCTLLLVTLLVCLSVLDFSRAVGVRKCIRLARRQRQLAQRDEFENANCRDESTLDSLVEAINGRCRAGLCAGLRRRQCKLAVREVFVVEIFPGECEEVPPCVPEVCLPNQCRSTFDGSLAFPANCPEVCNLEGFCAVTVCDPVIPDCASGEIVDEASCSCVPAPRTLAPGETASPVTTTTAAPTTTVAPTATPGLPCIDCCTDSDSGDGQDSGCPADRPFCANADGSPAVGQGECFVCREGGAGCTSPNSVCAFSFSGFSLAPGFYGNACFVCLNSALSGIDEGCTSALPNCNSVSNQAGSACLPECFSSADCPAGESLCVDGRCEVCTAFEYGTAPGCTDASPICGTFTRSPLASDGDVGQACYVCENTGSDLDPGCAVGVCDASLGQLGDSCSTCRDSSSTGTDLGCDDALPRCVTTISGAACVA